MPGGARFSRAGAAAFLGIMNRAEAASLGSHGLRSFRAIMFRPAASSPAAGPWYLRLIGIEILQIG